VLIDFGAVKGNDDHGGQFQAESPTRLCSPDGVAGAGNWETDLRQRPYSVGMTAIYLLTA